MIKGLSVDNTRPLPATKPQQKTEKADKNGFADQLLGAKSERPENPNRNERKSPGRDTDREGNRSAEREKDSKSSDLRASRDVRKKDRRQEDDARDSDRASARSATHLPAPSQPIPAPRAPASSSDEDAPIVIENPKASDSEELKLPDFFSKAALSKGAKGTVAKDASAGGETAEILASSKDDETLTRQQAMEKFVAKMQSELGIPPEKLLQAFAQLDDKAMQAPPEQSMGQLMQALALTPKQEARATELYQDLLKTTGDSLLNESVAGMDESVKFDVMSPRDASLRKLNSSLDDLNNSFFRKDGLASEPKKAQSAVDSMDAEISKLMRTKTDGREVSNQSSQNGLGASAMMASALKDAVQDSSVDAETATADSNASLAGLMAQSSNPLAATGLASGSGGETDLSFLGKEAGEASVKSASAKTSTESSFAKEMSKGLKDEESDLGDVDVSTDAAKTIDAKADPSAVLDSAPPTLGAARPVATAPADMMMNRQATSQDEQDNVRDLIKEAQVMIKRGGGEMKMEMKPEGMGAIQLRVNVENGKVNVQMITESESAKHMLEKGLGELKSNLAAHELKVQSLSVDVGNDVKNQMDQQGTQDHARQRAQQFASDFMGQFRDERQGFRDGVLENKGWRQYGKSKGPEQLSPESVAKASSKSRSDNSKRLNLVA